MIIEVFLRYFYFGRLEYCMQIFITLSMLLLLLDFAFMIEF